MNVTSQSYCSRVTQRFHTPVYSSVFIRNDRIVATRLYFNATLVCKDFMNVTSESYCSRPNVSTLQSSVFIRGDHIVATRSYFSATLVCKDFMNVTSHSSLASFIRSDRKLQHAHIFTLAWGRLFERRLY